MTKRKTTRSVRKTKRVKRVKKVKKVRKVRKTRRQSAGSGVKITPSTGTLGNILTGMTITIAAAKAWDEWMGDSAKMNRIKTQGDKMTILVDHLVNRMAETLQYGIEELSRLDSKFDRFMRDRDSNVPEMRSQYRDVLSNLPNRIKREYERFVTESIYQLFILFNNSPNEVKFMKKYRFANGLSKNVIDNYSFNPQGLSRIRMFELLQHSSLINKSYEAFTRAGKGTKPTLPKKYSDYYNFIYKHIFPLLDRSLARGSSGLRQQSRDSSRSRRQSRQSRQSRQEESALRAFAQRSQRPQPGRPGRLSRQEESALQALAQRSQTGRYAGWSGTYDDSEDDSEDEGANYARQWMGRM